MRNLVTEKSLTSIKLVDETKGKKIILVSSFTVIKSVSYFEFMFDNILS